MGLLKRLLSLGSKRNKKQRPAAPDDIPDVPPLPAPPRPDRPSISPLDEIEHEAAVGRLLRSSSTRFVENREVNNAELPPLPHPINSVIQPPAVSTVSLVSSTIGHASTYNVTVHQRRRHASTEVPQVPSRGTNDKASKRHSTLAPNNQEDSRVLRLRSDPSVASLISLYDEHGKLAADAFSNSPPSAPKKAKEERAQCKRSGSTLRQLLGATQTYNDQGDSSEGDISWAERFLGEAGDLESNSSRSSAMIQTPVDRFIPPHAAVDLSFTSDISVLEPDNPAISSMEVELSLTDDQREDSDPMVKNNSPYRVADPATPQRASQVFDFLTRGKQSKPVEEVETERPLPEVPSAFSSPSDTHGSEDERRHTFDISTDFVPSRPAPSPSDYDFDATPQPKRTAPVSYSSKNVVASPQLHSCFSDDSHDVHSNQLHHRASTATVQATPAPIQNVQAEREVHVLMTGPTKVILTTATPMNDEPRLRGPRALPRRRSKENPRRRSAFAEVSNGHPKDPIRLVKHQEQRRSSGSSQRSNNSRHSYDGSGDRHHGDHHGSRKTSGSSTHRHGQRAQKENQLGLSVRTELPSTPLRSHTTGSSKAGGGGDKTLLKSVVQHSLLNSLNGNVAPANTSSDMSPVGRQIMADVRQQRMSARDRERDRAARRLERV